MSRTVYKNKAAYFCGVLAAGLVCMGMISGCSKGNADAASPDAQTSASFTPALDTSEPATVNIIGSLANFESLEAVITDFEEYYPNCTVLYSDLSSNYSEMLEPRLKSDDSVGIFIITNSEYQSDYLRDTCANLLDENIDLSAIRPEVISSVTVDGKLYQIPLALTTSGLMVNTSLLESEGLSVPGNYAEFLEACAKLKADGYTPIQGDKWSSGNQLIRNMALMLLSDEYSSADEMARLTEGASGSTAALEPAFERLGELTDLGYIDPEVNALYANNYDDTILRFFEGDVPFVTASTVTFSGTKKRESKSEHFNAEPFSYKFICTPLADDGSYSYIENWVGFAVNENCPDKKWAVEFMRFLYTKEEINKLAYIKGLPSVAVESDDDRFDEIYSEDNRYVYMNDTFFPGVVDEALTWTEKEIIDKKITAGEACARLEEFIRNPELMTEE